MKPQLPSTVIALAAWATLAVASAAFAADAPLKLPPYGADKPLPAPKITRQTLPNGLQVWVLPRKGLPRVDFVLALQGAGFAADPPERAGQAALLAGLLNEGTAQRDAREIAEAAQALGGAVGGNANLDGIFVSANALASQAEPMLKLLAEVALKPSFPDQEVKLARDNALQALKASLATPGFRADGAMARAIYSTHPYSRTQPTEAAINAATAAELRANHARRFRPDRALLVMVGPLSAPQALAWARGAFGDWKASGDALPETPAAPVSATPQRLLLERPGSVQATLRLGRPGAPARIEHYVPLRLTSTVLGAGFSSRINMNLREEKGYTYGASAVARSFRQGGSIVGDADVRNEVTGAALQEFINEYTRIGSELVPPAELTLHKRYLSGSYLLRTQQQAPLAQTLALNWLIGLPPNFIADFVPQVQKVTAEQVRDMGKQYFSPETQSIVVVGDKAAVAAQLKAFGEFVAPAK